MIPFIVYALVASSLNNVNEIMVYPPEIHVAADRPALFLIRARGNDGRETAWADGSLQLSIIDQKIAKLEGRKIYPVSAGQTKLVVQSGSNRLEVPVFVDKIEQANGVSFRSDVIPILTKSGCNSGGCHGAASGQDGFALSLFGYDPHGDYMTITRHMIARRINRSLPAESLLMKKALGAVPHTGGQKIEPGSLAHKTLEQWIREGARDDTDPPAKLTRLELYPREITANPKGKQRLVVIAHRADGSKRDVTHWAEFRSTNEDTMSVNADGIAHAHSAGETFLTTRFDTLTNGRSAIVRDEKASIPWVPRRQNNTVDQMVDRKLKRRGISPSPLCDDQTFIRRLSIDLRGKLPSEDEVAEFLCMQVRDKREKLIDSYLSSDQFVDLITMRWSELLKVRSGGKLSRQGVHRYSNWLRGEVEQNTPLDRLAHQLISASGETANNPAGYFFQTEKEITKQAENIAQIFLGMRLQCASCHNHPFDRWTMDDYYGFAAFLAQIGKKPGEDPREIILFHQGTGSVTHPVSGSVVAPKFLGDVQPDLGKKDPRILLADWIASESNEYFAPHMANTLWSWFFHRGIVDDPDDVRVSNPPANAPLLQYLSEQLVKESFDSRALIREICASRTYQAEVTTDQQACELFAGQSLRPLSAPVLHDVIVQLTESPTRFEATIEGTTAVQLTDGAVSNNFLTTFGRSGRNTVCTCETKDDPTLSQALHLVNGDTVHQKIINGKLIETWLNADIDSDVVVQKLFMRCLARQPSEEEILAITTQFSERPPQQVLEDLFWSLINSPEFLFNH